MPTDLISNGFWDVKIAVVNLRSNLATTELYPSTSVPAIGHVSAELRKLLFRCQQKRYKLYVSIPYSPSPLLPCCHAEGVRGGKSELFLARSIASRCSLLSFGFKYKFSIKAATPANQGGTITAPIIPNT